MHKDLPLNAAARSGQADCVAALIAGGASVDSQSEQGETALASAAAEGCCGCVAALLAAGASPTLAGHSDYALAHLAARRGHAGVLRLVLAAQPELALLKAEDGRTLVHLAAHYGHTDVLRLLLAARPEAALQRTPDGLTPAHVAARQDRTDVLSMLLSACPEAAVQQDASGCTPLEIALWLGRSEAALCLLELGALPPLEGTLELLAGEGTWAQPLYAALAARQPLTAEQWAQVPRRCAGLGVALAAVLERSEQEAALLVRHLPRNERTRLRMAALCLLRAQRRHHMGLPTPLVWRTLALAAAD